MMAHRFGLRALARGLHTTRAARAGGPAWGTEVNEPGGRLFGEKIRAPGEKRVPFDWELPYLGTLGIAAVMLYFGLPARPNTSINTWAMEEALERAAKREAAMEAAADVE